jgi:hypothetical protein
MANYFFPEEGSHRGKGIYFVRCLRKTKTERKGSVV